MITWLVRRRRRLSWHRTECLFMEWPGHVLWWPESLLQQSRQLTDRVNVESQVRTKYYKVPGRRAYLSDRCTCQANFHSLINIFSWKYHNAGVLIQQWWIKLCRTCIVHVLFSNITYFQWPLPLWLHTDSRPNNVYWTLRLENHLTPIKLATLQVLFTVRYVLPSPLIFLERLRSTHNPL